MWPHLTATGVFRPTVLVLGRDHRNQPDPGDYPITIRICFFQELDA
jgi:hypothetical protein